MPACINCPMVLRSFTLLHAQDGLILEMRPQPCSHSRPAGKKRTSWDKFRFAYVRVGSWMTTGYQPVSKGAMWLGAQRLSFFSTPQPQTNQCAIFSAAQILIRCSYKQRKVICQISNIRTFVQPNRGKRKQWQ